MVRLVDLPEWEREHLLQKNMEPLGPTPWVGNRKPLSERHIALITTAGLHFREDEAFEFADASYRVIPRDAAAGELVISHSSVNFDRTGFQDDVNVVFPIDRFRELEAEGVVGRLSPDHFSFMGAGLPPAAYETSVRRLAGILKRAEVDTVFLTPV